MTYSIVAIDKENGQMGVGVQSHYFSVGATVTWACSGKGVVATQSLADMRYGYLGLDAMGAGISAKDALHSLLDSDLSKEMRQVAFIDTRGNISAYTGERCIREAGHITGADFSCQANIMERDTVWQKMADAYVKSEGQALDKRILNALKAAESEGGDLRGMQSAAILVTNIIASEKPWNDTLIDVRVEDHYAPLDELERLLDIKHAYQMMDTGDMFMEKGEVKGALDAYSTAQSLYPAQIEISFWKGVSLAQAGNTKDAKIILTPILEKEERWKELLSRLPDAKMLERSIAEEMLATRSR